jgi:hypothetical protein
MSVTLRCPRCKQEVTVYVPVPDAWCGRCSVPLERQEAGLEADA